MSQSTIHLTHDSKEETKWLGCELKKKLEKHEPINAHQRTNRTCISSARLQNHCKLTKACKADCQSPNAGCQIPTAGLLRQSAEAPSPEAVGPAPTTATTVDPARAAGRPPRWGRS